MNAMVLADTLIRVLVVDDEPAVLDAYRQVLVDATRSPSSTAIRDLRARLFSPDTPPGSARRSDKPGSRFDATFCQGAEAAVTAVRDAVELGQPYSVVFLDMRMPPGPDGAWAAEHIRALDPLVEIVVCTAFADVDPQEIGRRAPPDDKLFYLQKPFHPHEVRQLARALGNKRRNVDRRKVELDEIDTLTGLSNRASFLHLLAASLDNAQRQSEQLALLYIDLDGFRRVNDSLGHGSGDELLRVVAQRLRALIDGSPSARCARLGGDEFAVMLMALPSADLAADFAARVIDALARPARLGTQDFSIAASIGIAVYQRGTPLADTLVRNASVAMQRAKEQGRGKLAFFDETMSAGAQLRFSIETQLQGALQRQEFSLYYQPVFRLDGGGLAGLEALLRWDNVALGRVPPGDFIPIAEECGLILPIGSWVLRQACTEIKAWQEGGLATGRVAVNVSALQFAQRDFPRLVAQILEETGLAPASLELEITESLLMTDRAWVRQALEQLKALGVTIAIDDFGTGYSSFSRLTDFPIDRLKIDRSFVQNINDSSSGAAVAAAMIAMARALRLEVVAEGVENVEQMLHLQEQGCHEAQGYLLSLPLSVADAWQFLQRLSVSGRCDVSLLTAKSPRCDAGGARQLGG
ncbi:MAG: EAL domain-containing protein [Pseudomonadota bacterium]